MSNQKHLGDFKDQPQQQQHLPAVAGFALGLPSQETRAAAEERIASDDEHSNGCPTRAMQLVHERHAETIRYSPESSPSRFSPRSESEEEASVSDGEPGLPRRGSAAVGASQPAGDTPSIQPAAVAKRPQARNALTYRSALLAEVLQNVERQDLQLATASVYASVARELCKLAQCDSSSSGGGPPPVVLTSSNVQRVYQIVMRWAFELLHRPLRSGLKALIMVRCILPSRILCSASKALVDQIGEFVLLQQTLSAPSLTVEYHNRRLGLSDRCVKVVMEMRRFMKSYHLLQSRSLRDGAIACVSYDHVDGRLTSMSEGMVSHIHEAWYLTMNDVAPCRASIPRQHIGRAVAKALLRSKRIRIRNQATLNGRSASEPRRYHGRPSHVRSRSISPPRSISP